MANGEAGSGPFWGKPEWCGEGGYYKMLASSFGNLLASGESRERERNRENEESTRLLQTRKNMEVCLRAVVVLLRYLLRLLCW